jgi:hypothetical protein
MYQLPPNDQFHLDSGIYGVNHWKKIFKEKGWHLVCTFKEEDIWNPLGGSINRVKKQRWVIENIGRNNWHTYNTSWWAFERLEDAIFFRMVCG